MKGNHWFIIGIVVFLLLMFAVECRLPKKFVWAPTFSHYDKQPFGCALFDELLSSSLPNGYSLSSNTFYQLAQEEDTVSRRGILAIAEDLNLSNVDVEALLQLAERGNKVMLISGTFNKSLKDTLKFQNSYSYFSPATLKKAASLFSKDTLYWVGDSAVYSPQAFYYYPQLCLSHFFPDSLSFQVLAKKERPVAISRPWGKGEIILATTPLIFTNYGILDGKNATYVFRILSRMGDLPIIRTEGYLKKTAQRSPFRYFLSQKPLRQALYLTVICILLFMVFTARRRQRVMPVIRKPENKSLEFIELIGTLYYQKKDHTDLIRKKYLYFAETLRTEIQVDIEEVSDDERTFRRIARKTGMDIAEISAFIREVRPVIYGGYEANEELMKSYIDKMNEITNHI